MKNIDYFVKITLSRGKKILLHLDFQGHPIDQADVCLHCHHGQMAILGVKGKPLEVHGTSDLWSDWIANIERPSTFLISCYSKSCSVENKTGHRSALFCVEYVDFVFRRPKVIKQACIQVVIIERVSVIDKNSVVFPIEPESKHAVKTEVRIWYLKHMNTSKRTTPKT